MPENLHPRRFDWFSMVRRREGVTLAVVQVAASLALDFLNAETGDCFPSVDTIAEHSGVSGRSVKTALETLEAAGWLTVERHRGRGRTSTYRLRFPGNVVPISRSTGRGKVQEKGEAGCTFSTPEDPVKGEAGCTFSGAEKVKIPTVKGEARFTPYINPRRTQGAQEPARPRAREAAPGVSVPAVHLPASDTARVGDWSAWLHATYGTTLHEMGERVGLRPGAAFPVPSRFPPRIDNAEKRAEAAAFFLAVYGVRFASATTSEFPEQERARR